MSRQVAKFVFSRVKSFDGKKVDGKSNFLKSMRILYPVFNQNWQVFEYCSVKSIQIYKIIVRSLFLVGALSF